MGFWIGFIGTSSMRLRTLVAVVLDIVYQQSFLRLVPNSGSSMVE